MHSYGEKGTVIISHALYDIFPKIPPERIAPLDQNSFRSRVLLPETALLLIREDLAENPEWAGKKVPKKVALKVMKDSAKYGSAMFPEDDGETGVGDQALKKRAKARRKEIEQEEAREQEEAKAASSSFSEFDDDRIVFSSDDEDDTGSKVPLSSRKKLTHHKPLSSPRARAKRRILQAQAMDWTTG